MDSNTIWETMFENAREILWKIKVLLMDVAQQVMYHIFHKPIISKQNYHL